jgi:hypothetical protein
VAINADLVLAGIGAGGASGAELAWFAPSGVAAPTDSTTALTAGVNETQTVTITGTPTGGTFTLSYAGQTTAGIAWNATAAAVKSALEALTTIGTGNVGVTGGPAPGTAFVVTFRADLGITDVALMTASAASLTGGTSPAVGVAQTTAGVSGFLSAGLISEDGISKNLSNDANEIRAYGLSSAVRKIVTSETIEFQVVFLESNPVSLAVYNRLPLTGATAINPSSTGAFSITEGSFRSQRYALVIDVVDDDHLFRIYAPSVEVTEKESFAVKAGEAITYGVTLTAYPNSSGVSVETFYLLPELSAS